MAENINEQPGIFSIEEESNDGKPFAAKLSEL